MSLHTLYTLLAMAGGSGGEGTKPSSPFAMYGQFILIAAVLVIMYMLLIRPQRKREQKRRDMIGAIKEKDEVVTIGGIYGKIVAVKEYHLILNIDKDTNVRVSKGAISRVIPPGAEDTGEDVR